jgi:NAD(P)-dependent dehydrogenase (short-subunit alcohol dehydrogenase family)
MASTNLFDLTGRVAAVIGAGSGIGEAVALGCAAHGAHVACLDLNEDAVARVAARATADAGSAESARLDITDSAAVEQAFAQLRARRGSLDIVICTPAINVRKPILRYSDEEFARVLDVNMKGSFGVLRAAGRIMVEQRRGSIILFSSIRAQVVEPGQAAYAATKAGVLQMVRTAAAEFGPYGVRVNAIGPGVVETPLTRQIRSDKAWSDAYAAKSVFNRWARADEMVGPTVFLASDAASYVTGTILFADGGWLAADGRFTPPGM